MSTVSMSGTTGTTGPNGAMAGYPGGQGGLGGNASAVNLGNGVDISNFALAAGGTGGTGGNGGGGAGAGGFGGGGGNGGTSYGKVDFTLSYSGPKYGIYGKTTSHGGAGGATGKPGNYGGAGTGYGGLSGDGGAASATAVVINPATSGHGAEARAYSYGGAGGAAYGPSGQAGIGGVADATSAEASGASAYVTADQVGGAGGAGLGGASGNRGATSTLLDAVSGESDGHTLGLYQFATGGAGGASEGGTAGAGGDGYSDLTLDDAKSATPSSTLIGKVAATGGAGGAGTAGSNGGAGALGFGFLSLTGAGAVQAIVVGTGGAGGAGATVGTPGPGQALLTVVGTYIIAKAKAHGGQGASQAGHGYAESVTTGTGGTFTAHATTSLAAGALVTAASAKSTGKVDGKQSAKANVVIGQAAFPEVNGQAVANETGAPSSASTTAVLTANPAIKTTFGASPVFFAIDELGGQYAKSGGTGPETNTETVNLTVDLTQLASEQDLVVGFYNGRALGTGFTSMTLAITADGGATPLFTQTFTTLASAETFFTNNAMDLGKLGTGALAGNTLTLTATLSITTDSHGDGFYASLIVGDPPGVTAWPSRFAQHMAELVASASGSPGAVATAAGVREPMLAIARIAAFA